MGLSASQARLLSLTNRQHDVERRAQALQHNKMRLANDSDAAYHVYLDALNDTMLKTYQTNSETGSSGWIDGTINNLMRNGTASNTTGNVFYVQDIATGKLYIPSGINLEDEVTVSVKEALNQVSGNTLDEQARSFAEGFGVVYTAHDMYEEDRINYERAVSKGWNTILGGDEAYCDMIASAYSDVLEENKKLVHDSNMAMAFIPTVDSNGNYITHSYDVGYVENFKNYINKIIENKYYEITVEKDDNHYGGISVERKEMNPYTPEQVTILQAAVNLLDVITNDKPVNHTDEDGVDYEYITKSITAQKDDDNKYLNIDGDELSYIDKFNLMLNGGTLTWNGVEIKKYHLGPLLPDKEDDYSSPPKDIYSGYGSKDYATLLQNAGYSSFGEALNDIVGTVANSNSLKDNFMLANSITESDIENFHKYKEYKAKYNDYINNPKVYEYIPNNRVKADQYEQLYKALVSTGKSNTITNPSLSDSEKFIEYAKNGYIECDDERSNNSTWVSNMVKNAQVILTMWDVETEMLSKTSTALNTKIREVTNNSRVDKASQVYEAKLDEINDKDKKYDTMLKKLESERTAIQTEIDSLENVIKNNIDRTFKIFG